MVVIVGSILKGIVVVNVIDDAMKIIDAVTSIVNEVNFIVESDIVFCEVDVNGEVFV